MCLRSFFCLQVKFYIYIYILFDVKTDEMVQKDMRQQPVSRIIQRGHCCDLT